MKNVRHIIRGLGTALNRTYDRRTVVQKAIAELETNSSAIDFVQTEGWKVLRRKYEGMIVELQAHVLSLSRKAVKNAVEIQETSDFISAFIMVVELTDQVVLKQKDLSKTAIKNQIKNQPLAGSKGVK